MNNTIVSQTELRHSLIDGQGLPSYCALIVNPESGNYKKAKIAATLAALENSGLKVELFITDSVQDTESCTRQVCVLHERPLIIVGGGDGTISGVINGLSSHAVLALLPLGTANVLAAELNIASFEVAVARIIRGETRPLSVGLLDNGVRQRYFFLMAGIGVDGSVVEKVGMTKKKLLGRGAYLLSALQHFLFWEREKLAISFDGIEKECHSIIICNAAHYGGTFQLAHGTNIFSHMFEVICVMSEKRRAYLKLAVNLITGKPVFKEEIVRFTGREFMVSGRKAIQLDGDFFGQSPVTIKIVSDYARVIV